MAGQVQSHRPTSKQLFARAANTRIQRLKSLANNGALTLALLTAFKYIKSHRLNIVPLIQVQRPRVLAVIGADKTFQLSPIICMLLGELN